MVSLERQQSPGTPVRDSARSEPFPAGTSIARYRILSFIGSGAMGDVYRAHDRALDREVALKVLPPEVTGDRDRVRRFAQEARAASALSHPHSALRVFRIPAAGGTAQSIVDGRALKASVSPDGKTILCTTGGEDGFSGRISTLPVQGGPVRTFDQDGMLVRWTPDGSAIAFVKDGNLWLQPNDGGAAKKVTAFTDGSIADYRWTSEGTRAIVAHVSDAVDVVVIR